MVRISIVRLSIFINATAEAAITDHGQKWDYETWHFKYAKTCNN